MSLNVYVASSWRNDRQPQVVTALRAGGHSVYDFRNPAPGDDGFAWAHIAPTWQLWSAEQKLAAYGHPLAEAGFRSDMDALDDADAVVMVQPCGVSAALELGYAVGAGKITVVLLGEGEPELMLAMAGALCLTVEDVLVQLAAIEEGA